MNDWQKFAQALHAIAGDCRNKRLFHEAFTLQLLISAMLDADLIPPDWTGPAKP